ncbi:MAG: hypothetical protein LBE13_15805 [Bacteroidales bacterium]|jgi:uncharacterized protein (TIGR02145 family)|nr:hypothetical protein [Bacteroidales bacterium]
MTEEKNSNNDNQNVILVPENKNNGIGITGFVLALNALFIGITGFVLALIALSISWMPVVGWILGILGLVFSFIGLFKRPRGFAIAGFVISLIDLVFKLLVVFAGIGVLLGLLGLASHNSNDPSSYRSPTVELYEESGTESDEYFDISESYNESYSESYNEPYSESYNTSYSQFQRGDYAKATEDKVYFYTQPNESSKKQAYLSNGDVVEFLEIIGEFGYVEFLHPVTKRTTKGWLRLEDMGRFDNEITINGVTWNRINIGANNFYDYGDYYTLEEAKSACPPGWRLPTKDEFQKLINSGYLWKTVYGVKGQLFGSGEETVFFPASGYSNEEEIEHADNSGFYWTSSYGDDYEPFYLGFSSRTAQMFDNEFAYKANVRCVKKNNNY